jgi:hypothetical protein
MTGSSGSAAYSPEDRARHSEQARSQFRIKGRFARAGRGAPATAVEYNLDVEEDIKPSEEDLMLPRSTGGGASAARRTQVGVAADKKGKCRAPVSASAKKQMAIPHGKRGRGSSSTHARNKVSAHAYQWT